MTAAKARSVVQFERNVNALAGIYYRRDRGLLTGRNASSTDAYIDGLVKSTRELLRAELDDENSPLYAELDRRPKLAAKWDRLERRYYGLPA